MSPKLGRYSYTAREPRWPFFLITIPFCIFTLFLMGFTAWTWHDESREGFITVTVPFNRLGSEVYNDLNVQIDAPANVQVVEENVQVTEQNAQVTEQNAQVNVQVEGIPENQVLTFCIEPRTLLEISEELGYKDRRSTRKILNPLLEQGRIAMTIPDKPKSRLQKYITITYNSAAAKTTTETILVPTFRMSSASASRQN